MRHARRYSVASATFSLLALSTAVAPARLNAQSDSTPKRVAVRAGRLIDGKGGAPISNAVLLIQDGRITAVGSGIAIP